MVTRSISRASGRGHASSTSPSAIDAAGRDHERASARRTTATPITASSEQRDQIGDALGDDDRRGLRRRDVVQLAQQVALHQLAELRGRDRERQPGAEHQRARPDRDARPAGAGGRAASAGTGSRSCASDRPSASDERPPAEPGEPVAELRARRRPSRSPATPITTTIAIQIQRRTDALRITAAA